MTPTFTPDIQRDVQNVRHFPVIKRDNFHLRPLGVPNHADFFSISRIHAHIPGGLYSAMMKVHLRPSLPTSEAVLLATPNLKESFHIACVNAWTLSSLGYSKVNPSLHTSSYLKMKECESLCVYVCVYVWVCMCLSVWVCVCVFKFRTKYSLKDASL